MRFTKKWNRSCMRNVQEWVKKFPTGRSAVYTKRIMQKKTSTGGPTASGAVSSGSFIMPQKKNFIWRQPEKMKICWIRPFTASSAFTTIPVSCGSTALSLITASQVPKKPKSAASMQPLFWPEDTIQTENLSGHGILNV